MNLIKLPETFQYPKPMKKYNYIEFVNNRNDHTQVNHFQCPRCDEESLFDLAMVDNTGEEVAYQCDCGLCFQRWGEYVYIWETEEKKRLRLPDFMDKRYIDFMSDYKLTKKQLDAMFNEMKDVIDKKKKQSSTKISFHDRINRESPFKFPDDPSSNYEDIVKAVKTKEERLQRRFPQTIIKKKKKKKLGIILTHEGQALLDEKIKPIWNMSVDGVKQVGRVIYDWFQDDPKFKCDKCKGTTKDVDYCDNPSCPNMPCCGKPKEDCECEIKKLDKKLDNKK